VAAGYRMASHEHSADIVLEKNYKRKVSIQQLRNYYKKLLEHLEIMLEKRIPKLLSHEPDSGRCIPGTSRKMMETVLILLTRTGQELLSYWPKWDLRFSRR
jgi:hypothetical protein